MAHLLASLSTSIVTTCAFICDEDRSMELVALFPETEVRVMRVILPCNIGAYTFLYGQCLDKDV